MNKSDAPLQLERIALSIEEAAASLGVNRERVRAEVQAGRLPHVEIGERILIGKRALEAWLTRECLASVQETVSPASTRTALAVQNFRRRRSAV